MTTSSAGSSRSHRRRRRPSPTSTATAQRAVAPARATRPSRNPSSKPSRTSTSRASTRIKRSFQGKLQPMVLPSDRPSWLRSLMQVQRGIWVGTIGLSAIALATYGWSVYSQQQWGMAYSQLQRLQRNERQLISGNEMMKNQIAQQVDPKSLGLAPQKANDVIFIKPEHPQAAAKPAAPAADPATPPAQPLGY
jgi:hypothetical protein